MYEDRVTNGHFARLFIGLQKNENHHIREKDYRAFKIHVWNVLRSAFGKNAQNMIIIIVFMESALRGSTKDHFGTF